MAWCEKLKLKWGDFALEVEQWQFPDQGITAVFGESGSGKTTLLQVLAGLIPCPGFQLSLQGELVTEQPPRSRNISFVFQDFGLFAHMTAFENIAFAATAKKIPPMMWSEQAERLIQRLGLDRVRHQRARTLSGGEQQRVALARALVSKPRLICLDEPLSALDEKRRDETRGLILELSDEYRVPFILVTHDLRDVRALSKSLLLLERGQVVDAGETVDLLNFPRTLDAAQAIPENQFISVVSLQAAGFNLEELKNLKTRKHAAPALVVAKPWSFEAQMRAASSAGLQATVVHALNEGARWRVHAKLKNDADVIAWSALDIKPGQVVNLNVDMNSLVLFEEEKS